MKTHTDGDDVITDIILLLLETLRVSFYCYWKLKTHTDGDGVITDVILLLLETLRMSFSCYWKPYG